MEIKTFGTNEGTIVGSCGMLFNFQTLFLYI